MKASIILTLASCISLATAFPRARSTRRLARKGGLPPSSDACSASCAGFVQDVATCPTSPDPATAACVCDGGPTQTLLATCYACGMSGLTEPVRDDISALYNACLVANGSPGVAISPSPEALPRFSLRTLVTGILATAFSFLIVVSAFSIWTVKSHKRAAIALASANSTPLPSPAGPRPFPSPADMLEKKFDDDRDMFWR